MFHTMRNASIVWSVLVTLGYSAFASVDPGYPCRDAYVKKVQKLEKRKAWAIPAAIVGGAAGVGIAGRWPFYDGEAGKMVSGWEGNWNVLHFAAAGGLGFALGALAKEGVEGAIAKQQQGYAYAGTLLDALDASYTQIVDSAEALFMAKIRLERIRELQEVNQWRRSRGESELSLEEWLTRYPLPVFPETQVPELVVEKLVPGEVREKLKLGAQATRGEYYEAIRLRLLDLRGSDAFCEGGNPLPLKKLLKVAFE